MKALVAHDAESKAALAHVVNRKGGSGAGAVRAAVEALDLLGCKRILLEGGQEPAVKELRSRVEASGQEKRFWSTRPSAARQATER